MPPRSEFAVDPSPTPSTSRRAWQGPGVVEWIGGWFSILTAVLVANLLTVVVLALVGKWYVDRKVDEFNREWEKTMKEVERKQK